MTGVSVTFANQGSAMTSYIRLEAHYLENVPGGVRVGAFSMPIEVGTDMKVDFPAPFVAIGGGLAVAPQVEVDGVALRIDLTRWAPMRTGPAGGMWPFNIAPQDLAIRITRAFDADRSTTWQDSSDAIAAWLRRHAADFGLHF